MKTGVDVLGHRLQHHIVVQTDDRVADTCVCHLTRIAAQRWRSVLNRGNCESELVPKQRRHKRSVRSPGLTTEKQVRPPLCICAHHDLRSVGCDYIADELLKYLRLIRARQFILQIQHCEQVFDAVAVCSVKVVRSFEHLDGIEDFVEVTKAARRSLLESLRSI